MSNNYAKTFSVRYISGQNKYKSIENIFIFFGLTFSLLSQLISNKIDIFMRHWKY